MYISPSSWTRLVKSVLLACVLAASAGAQAVTTAATPVAEPGSVALLGLGVLLLAGARRRTRRY